MRFPGTLIGLLLVSLTFALMPASAAAQQEREDTGARFEFGGNVEVQQHETLGFLLAADSAVIINGTIDGSIVLLGSDTILNGRVDGHVIAAGGTLRLTESAVITGDLSYNATTIQSDPGALVLGTTRDDLAEGFSRDLTRYMAWLSLANWVGTTLLALAAGMVFAGIGGRQLWECAGAMTGKPLQSIFAIFLCWAVAGVMIVALFFSVLGIPVALILMLLLATIWMLGYIVAGTRIGAALTRRSINNPDEQHPYLPVVAGIALIQIVALLPVVITLFLALTVVDGATRISPAYLVATSVYWSVSALIWLIGMLGSGAIVYQAFRSWVNNDSEPPSTPQQRDPAQV